MPIKIRVKSKSNPDIYHIISVDELDDSIGCDCSGFLIGDAKICRHIDAVLIANERAMVHPDDYSAADRAWSSVVGKISVPASWRATWRQDLRWRGLAGGPKAVANPRNSGRPLVCFTGTLPGKTRAEWIAEATAHGWDATDGPSRFTDVLVAADPHGTSSKLKKAREFQTPIVTADEWAVVMTDGVLPDHRPVHAA